MHALTRSTPHLRSLPSLVALFDVKLSENVKQLVLVRCFRLAGIEVMIVDVAVADYDVQRAEFVDVAEEA